MTIHVVNKGKNGEREIADLLRTEIYVLIARNTWDDETNSKLYDLVQRNQNQSAEGGGDINLLGLSVEVKRCETLEVEKWWRQATASAERNGDAPVLIYRQNRKAWHVVMEVGLGVTASSTMRVRGTIDIESFKMWFSAYAKAKIDAGELNRI